MTTTSKALEVYRRKSTWAIVYASCAMTAVVLIAGLLVGAHILHTVLPSAVVAGLGFAAATLRPHLARIAVSILLLSQGMFLTAAFQGHAWQLDTHMVYFALLASLVALVDRRAVFIAAAFVVLHHLAMTFLMPTMIYPPDDLLTNLGRTLFHGAVVAVQTCVLFIVIKGRIAMNAAAKERATQLTELSKAADAARSEAEAALERAEAERAITQKAMAEAEVAKEAAERQRREVAQKDQVLRETEAREAHSLQQRRDELDGVLQSLRNGLAKLSEGDLSVRIEEALAGEFDALRSDFNGAVYQLAGAIGEANAYSARFRGEAEDIARATADLSSRTERQSATLEETAAAMAEMTSLVRSAAEMAGEAAQLASSAHDGALESGEVVERAVSAMGEIEASSKQIARITGVIDDIAFQTNLLALNAGVEAARAGDAGRGFAVVASEVRALAQRSSEAAKEINALIQNSEAQVRDGVELVGQTGTTLEKILDAVRDTASRVNQIATTSKEQASGLAAINQAVTDLDRVTQQNATMFEDTTAACQSLKVGADEMESSMSKFRHDGGQQSVGSWPAAS